MVIVQVFLSVKEFYVEDFVAETMANVVHSLKEPGVQRFEFLRDCDTNGAFVLFEIYDSAEAQNAHRASDHYKKWKENTQDMLEKPYTHREYEYAG